MRPFLGFTIYAPFASWGAEAVGEVRGSQRHATRSAILGLIGAALGVRRDDSDGLRALDEGFGVAVRVDVAGDPLRDYHTSMSTEARVFRKQAPRTRRELLKRGEAADANKTMLSTRMYQIGSVTRLVVWATRDSPWTLDAVAQSLEHPRFVLCAGRKANPIGWPLRPRVKSASTLGQAFSTLFDEGDAFWPLFGEFDGTDRPSPQTFEVHHDPCVGFSTGLETIRRSMPRDRAVSRAAWMFRTRPMETSVMGGTG